MGGVPPPVHRRRHPRARHKRKPRARKRRGGRGDRGLPRLSLFPGREGEGGEPVQETKAQRAERLKGALNPWAAYAEIQRFARDGVGSIPPEWLGTDFRWWGIYTQGDGVGAVGGKGGEGRAVPYFMLRIRIPNGFLTAAQLRTVAGLAQRYAPGLADLTVRQNLHLHAAPAARCGGAAPAPPAGPWRRACRPSSARSRCWRGSRACRRSSATATCSARTARRPGSSSSFSITDGPPSASSPRSRTASASASTPRGPRSCPRRPTATTWVFIRRSRRGPVAPAPPHPP